MNLAYLAYYSVLETHKPGSLEEKLEFLDKEKEIPLVVYKKKRNVQKQCESPADKGMSDTISFLYHHKRKKSCTQHYLPT